MSQNIWRNLKYKNVAVLLAVVLLFILIIASSCSKGGSNNNHNVVSTVSKQVKPDNAQSKNSLSDNSEYVEIVNNDILYSGNLILVNKEHEYAFKDQEPESLTSMYKYSTNKNGKMRFAMTDSSVSVSQNFAVALSNLLIDFYKSSKNNTVMLTSGYRTVEEQKELYNADTESTGAESVKYNKEGFSESHTGLAIDLGINTEGYPEYKGTGKFQWITDNAAKYGIITRYTKDKESITGIQAEPWHLRYVGVPHAEIMVGKALCLEEYHDFLKTYSYDKPLIYTASNNIKYGIYYTKAAKDKTSIQIPLDENGSQYNYEISGNNVDGFIITVNLGEDAEAIAAQSSAAELSSASAALQTEAPVNNNTQPTQATSDGDSDSVITASTTTVPSDEL